MVAKFRGAKKKNIKTRIDGLKEVEKLLEDIGVSASDVLDKAANAGGEIALEDAKRRCPTDSGRLKASLNLKKSKTKKPEVRQEVKIAPGRKEYYGTFVELGTANQPAQPFMRPAIDENKDKIAKAINDEVLKAVGRLR